MNVVGPGILDVLPIIFDEASFPVDEKCTFHSSHVSSSSHVNATLILHCFRLSGI